MYFHFFGIMNIYIILLMLNKLKKIDKISSVKIKEIFFIKFAHGICLTPQLELGKLAKPISDNDIQSLNKRITQFLYEDIKYKDFHYNISILYIKDTIEYVFLVPKRKYSHRKYFYWQNFIKQQNFAFLFK